ncbi:hypothetical protein SODALDRAFT_379473 [Sodiomyces alkalinus F11]|uniref:37S ribosomal protein mrp10, mitochondrial n=1 Tax=Sodiomyces alkalinus (strain CBS 110278 / VKM F-3762 / F11) TaxID=1314773 RepID=A0A3N2PUV1_SODAK|nr:hypothetical protein SODALDRAFT_379473 [Sodiomyces alkalinus F11]ROT38277.1 hypothetical protein SODALDRAFT_379473 [Sodiomyces alkalinus F11]
MVRSQFSAPLRGNHFTFEPASRLIHPSRRVSIFQTNTRVATYLVASRSSAMPAAKPIRLPPVKSLRVRNARKKVENPCINVMNSVLACWASAGYNTAGCAALENALRTCMDAPLPAKAPTSSINYHLNRMYDRVIPNATRRK